MKSRLDSLIAEAKAEGTKPRVSDDAWNEMEALLLAEVAQVKAQSSVSSISQRPRVGARNARFVQLGVAALAVAAATFLIIKKDPGAARTEQILPDPGAGALSARDGAGEVRVSGKPITPGQVLHRGDVVEAQGARAFLERPNQVTWLLDGTPDTVARARVKSTGDSLVLGLEDGAVEAQVTPVPAGEPFAIDIATEQALVRVAVHGTHLRVARAGSLVTVDLTEGVVSIGAVDALGARAHDGTNVTAPSHVEFDAASLDSTLKVDHTASAVRAAVPLDHGHDTSMRVSRLELGGPPSAPQMPVTNPAPNSTHPADKPHAVEASSPGERSVKAPAPAVAVSSRDAIANAVRTCAAARPREESVRVTVSSSLRLRVGATGDVQAAQFDPPLQPEIQTCAANAIYKLKVTDAEGGSLIVPIDFTY